MTTMTELKTPAASAELSKVRFETTTCNKRIFATQRRWKKSKAWGTHSFKQIHQYLYLSLWHLITLSWTIATSWCLQDLFALTFPLAVSAFAQRFPEGFVASLRPTFKALATPRDTSDPNFSSQNSHRVGRSCALFCACTLHAVGYTQYMSLYVTTCHWLYVTTCHYTAC